ncbi:hypothetical protein [Streptomyces spectabilis]|uniref:Uncharacterized protein n=1 Tax=Streptomyces spectabilis TaxID=68270 RepID=A0A7W8B3U2_STRST|nr:hypothetical protein [Streptomyces spectabilis]MBB5109831.1 hypothetical protein [Streptomyces spectabilis]
MCGILISVPGDDDSACARHAQSRDADAVLAATTDGRILAYIDEPPAATQGAAMGAVDGEVVGAEAVGPDAVPHPGQDVA